MISEHGTAHYNSRRPEEHEQALERRDDEVRARSYARKQSLKTAKSTSRTDIRITEFIEGSYKKWDPHEKFTYFFFMGGALSALGAGSSFVFSIITSSGIIPMFTEQPLLAVLVSTIPIIGSLVLKAIEKLFGIEELKKGYLAVLSAFGVIALLSTVINYSLVFEASGQSPIAGLFDDSAPEESPYYKVWLASQLILEFISGALVFSVAEIIHNSRREKKSAINPNYYGRVDDQEDHHAYLLSINNRIGHDDGYLQRIDAGLIEYIGQCISYYHDVKLKLKYACEQGVVNALDSMSMEDGNISHNTQNHSNVYTL